MQTVTVHIGFVKRFRLLIAKVQNNSQLIFLNTRGIVLSSDTYRPALVSLCIMHAGQYIFLGQIPHYLRKRCTNFVRCICKGSAGQTGPRAMVSVFNQDIDTDTTGTTLSISTRREYMPITIRSC